MSCLESEGMNGITDRKNEESIADSTAFKRNATPRPAVLKRKRTFRFAKNFMFVVVVVVFMISPLSIHSNSTWQLL